MKSGLVLPRLRDIETNMSSKNIKTRRFCFTIHNYTKKDLTKFHELAESLDKHHYICYGLEKAPNTGTKHIQGYIELNQSQRFTFLHNYFKFSYKGKPMKFHIDIANGTAEQNKKYTSKEGDFYEFGEPTTQGARNDLKNIKEEIKANPKRLNEIIDEYGNNLQQVKYAQSLQSVYFKHRDSKNPPQVLWLFGRSGIGKTRLVYENFEDICSVSSWKWPGTDYQQNECLLFDDFRCDDMPFTQILKITDRYPFNLEYKGGQTPLNSPYIIFTCPCPIEEEFEFEKESLKQILRRVTQVNLDELEENLKEVDLKNLDDKFIFIDDTYSHHKI